jgi:hypothetical protein
MISVASTFLEEIPGEAFLTKHLQTPIKFILGQKTLKQGRLVIFKRAHYYLHITLLTSKNNKESFEIPIPFKVEEYPHENLAYFDYRIQGLCGLDEMLNDRLFKVKIKNTNPSQYYNKILEIQAENV